MKLPHPQITRDELEARGVNYGTFDGEEVVSACELYESLGIDGSGVNSLYISIQAAGIALDIASKLKTKQPMK